MQPRNKTHARLLKKLAVKETAKNEMINKLQTANSINLQNAQGDCWTINDDTDPGYAPRRNEMISNLKKSADLTEISSCTVLGTPIWGRGPRCFDTNLFRGINNSPVGMNATEPLITSQISAYCDRVAEVEKWAPLFFMGVILGSIAAAGIVGTSLACCFSACRRRPVAEENDSSGAPATKNNEDVSYNYRRLPAAN